MTWIFSLSFSSSAYNGETGSSLLSLWHRSSSSIGLFSSSGGESAASFKQLKHASSFCSSPCWHPLPLSVRLLSRDVIISLFNSSSSRLDALLLYLFVELYWVSFHNTEVRVFEVFILFVALLSRLECAIVYDNKIINRVISLPYYIWSTYLTLMVPVEHLFTFKEESSFATSTT